MPASDPNLTKSEYPLSNLLCTLCKVECLIFTLYVIRSTRMSQKSVSTCPLRFHIILDFQHMCLNTSKGTSCLWRSKLTLCYFLNGCSFISILVQKVLKLDIAFLSYGNFIEDVITDWWKVDLEKKALEIWESCTKYWYFGNSAVHFYMKTVFLHQILQVPERLVVEA